MVLLSKMPKISRLLNRCTDSSTARVVARFETIKTFARDREQEVYCDPALDGRTLPTISRRLWPIKHGASTLLEGTMSSIGWIRASALVK